jgi:hypothetical protein
MYGWAQNSMSKCQEERFRPRAAAEQDDWLRDFSGAAASIIYLEPISKPALDKYVLKTRLKVGNGDFSPPFLKGDLGGLSSPYIIPPAPL